jgi:xanthine dehydrogenase accessory factor
MKKNKEFWNFILSNLKDGNNVALIKVFESNGASPGKQGFMLAVNAQKDIQGTIGGGIMEYDGVERAVQRLIDNDSEVTPRVTAQDTCSE